MMKTKKEYKKVKIEFDERHLPIIRDALEVYSRMKSGQVGIALDTIWPEKIIKWEDRDLIEGAVREVVFPELDRNASYGVSCKEIGTGGAAYEIRKVIGQYIAYEGNDGYRKMMNVEFADPLKVTAIPFPVIEGFEKAKYFPIPKKLERPISERMVKMDYHGVWNLIDKNKVKYAKGDSWEIVVKENEPKARYWIKVNKPLEDQIKKN